MAAATIKKRSEAVSPSPNFVAAQLGVIGVLFVSQTQSAEHAHKLATVVARYLVYLLTARGLQQVCCLLHDSLSSKKLQLFKAVQQSKLSCLVYAVSVAFLFVSQLPVYTGDFPLLVTAYLICTYLQMEQRPAPVITYGTGMACSFFEGYLGLVIPSQGQHKDSFVDKIQAFEDGEGVVFPVKKMLLVIPRSLFCPPDLAHYNLPERHDLPQIEAIKSPAELERDVAGVKRRIYRNTGYKLYWAGARPPHPPVYLTAECATPLHTLYGVTQKTNLYEELSGVEVEGIVEDFCAQVERVVARSPDCRGKCELVYFDDRPGSGQYLPQVLLEKIQELEPNYRDIIERHADTRAVVPDSELLSLFPEPRVLHTPAN